MYHIFADKTYQATYFADTTLSDKTFAEKHYWTKHYQTIYFQTKRYKTNIVRQHIRKQNINRQNITNNTFTLCSWNGLLALGSLWVILSHIKFCNVTAARLMFSASFNRDHLYQLYVRERFVIGTCCMSRLMF